MMRKLSGLIVFSIMLTSSSAVFADALEALDASSVASLHQQVVSAFINKCQITMNMTQPICQCLGDHFNQVLNDAALRQCTSNVSTLSDCVTNQVTIASQTALSDENILNCVNNSVSGSTSPQADTPSLPGVPSIGGADLSGSLSQ